MAGHTAPGFDHWTYVDLSIYSVVAFDLIARLLNMIEDGVPCPHHALPSKAHSLLKTPDAPLDYKNRLRHLQPGVATWQLDNMLRGITGSGAEDAWYGLALEVELLGCISLPLSLVLWI